MQFFDNAHDAIRAGTFSTKLKGVAYRKGYGWFLYDPTLGVNDAESEFLCRSPGQLPIPVSEDGATILAQFIAGVAS